VWIEGLAALVCTPPHPLLRKALSRKGRGSIARVIFLALTSIPRRDIPSLNPYHSNSDGSRSPASPSSKIDALGQNSRRGH